MRSHSDVGTPLPICVRSISTSTCDGVILPAQTLAESLRWSKVEDTKLNQFVAQVRIAIDDRVREYNVGCEICVRG